jgi:predicted SnoaL-like aldol condensation-catalyzing enzyme
MEQQKQNKQTVISFYDQVFNQCKPAMRIERYAGDTHIRTTRSREQRTNFY